jgi:hypothetical protein
MSHDPDDTSELLDTIQRQAGELATLREALEAERQTRYAECAADAAKNTQEATFWVASLILAGTWLEVLSSFNRVLQFALDALYNSGHALQSVFLFLVVILGTIVATYVLLKAVVATYRKLRNRPGGPASQESEFDARGAGHP